MMGDRVGTRRDVGAFRPIAVIEIRAPIYDQRVGYWMIYSGPGFRAVVWFGSSPTSLPPPPWASSFSFLAVLCVWGESVSNQIRPRESLALFDSLNILWVQLLKWLTTDERYPLKGQSHFSYLASRVSASVSTKSFIWNMSLHGRQINMYGTVTKWNSGLWQHQCF